MTNPTPEAIEALRNYLRNPWYKCDDRARGPIPEWCIALMHEAADMLTALARREPDPTGGWCSDMEAVPYDEVVRRQEKDATP